MSKDIIFIALEIVKITQMDRLYNYLLKLWSIEMKRHLKLTNKMRFFDENGNLIEDNKEDEDENVKSRIESLDE